MAMEKRQSPLDEDDLYVRSRAGDRSIWSKSSYYAEKYRIIVYIVSVLGLYLGFGLRTPKDQFDAVHEEMKANKLDFQTQLTAVKQVQDTIRADRQLQTQMQRFSVRYICSKMSPDERYRLGGDDLCDEAGHTK